MSNIKVIADEILNSGCKCTEIQNRIQTHLLKVVEEWSQIMVNVNHVAHDRTEDDKDWKDFELLTRHLMSWIDSMKRELESIDEKIKRSSVEKLKHCFHEITVNKYERLFIKRVFSYFYESLSKITSFSIRAFKQCLSCI